MKDRILTGWTVRRMIYLTLGIAAVIHSFADKQWTEAIFGAYIAMMGLFAMGCAGGQCAVKVSYKRTKNRFD